MSLVYTIPEYLQITMEFLHCIQYLDKAFISNWVLGQAVTTI